MFFFLMLLAPLPGVSSQVVKIACIGNSITYGAGIDNRDHNSYPAQLQAWLGKQYDVRNYGVSGATLLKKGDKPYWKEPQFQQAIDFGPDIVIIKLGTNDSKPQNWKYADEFEGDLTEMVSTFRNLHSKPRILLALPVPVFVAERWGIRDSIVRDQVIPRIKNVAKATKTQYIDLYTPLLGFSYAFPDAVHPNSIGASMMVEEIYRALFYKDKMHSSGYLNTAILPAPGAECRGEAAGWGAGKDWFSQFEDINRLGAAQKPKVVLLGNSITQGWGGEGRSVWSPAKEIWETKLKPFNTGNFGISGDRTQHILWRVINGNFDSCRPSVVVLEIGVNNFPYHTASEISAGIQSIVKALQKKMPEVKILLYGPLPAGKDKNDPNRLKYKEVHAIIRGFENGKTVFYRNLDKVFINSDGTLVEGMMSPDAIHLAAGGYGVWADDMAPLISKLVPSK
jgi:lysophospholipase L1-like esterase